MDKLLLVSLLLLFQEWVDYDEKAKESVGIYEVEHNFVKVH